MKQHVLTCSLTSYTTSSIMPGGGGVQNLYDTLRSVFQIVLFHPFGPESGDLSLKTDMGGGGGGGGLTIKRPPTVE